MAYCLMDFAEKPPMFGKTDSGLFWIWVPDPKSATMFKTMQEAERALQHVRKVYPMTSTQVSIQQVVT